MNTLSKIISAFFHPMLMPTLGLFLIFQSGTHVSFISFEAKRIIYLTVFLSTCILPLSLLPLLYQFGLIKSFNMVTARERLLPVFLTGFFFYLGYMLLKKMGVTGLIGSFMLASLIGVFVAVAITFFWKISMHMIGVGGVVGAVLAISFKYALDLSGWIMLLFLMAGVVAAARLKLGAHKPAQIYVGFLVGSIIVFGSVFI
jgi:hypothetical protein